MINSVCSNCQPLRLIGSGQGGTGKSKVIDILNRIVSREVHDAALPVVIAAPTGLAAFSIGGTALHRLLNLPIEYGKPADYSRLQQEQLTLLKATLKGVRLPGTPARMGQGGRSPHLPRRWWGEVGRASAPLVN